MKLRLKPSRYESEKELESSVEGVVFSYEMEIKELPLVMFTVTWRNGLTVIEQYVVDFREVKRRQDGSFSSIYTRGVRPFMRNKKYLIKVETI